MCVEEHTRRHVHTHTKGQMQNKTDLAVFSDGAAELLYLKGKNGQKMFVGKRDVGAHDVIGHREKKVPTAVRAP